jgi:hypothetical protein
MNALLLIFAASLAAGPTSRGPTLTGIVQGEAGRPVAGATVFIRTAGPRQGVGVL